MIIINLGFYKKLINNTLLTQEKINIKEMAKEVKSVNYGLEKIFEGAQDFLPF